MLITKIELENFMCYSGRDNNVFDFTEGLNVIIGDTTFGKSKLYDAFNWVIDNHIYISELKGFYKTNSNEVREKIISDKAKFEAITDRVKTSVKITSHHREKDTVYIWEREYYANKINGKWIGDKDSVSTIWKKELSYMQARIVENEEDIKRITRKIIDPYIKEYMWFQGEQVETMIDFKDSNSLTKAINVLSKITIYDNYKQTAEYLYKNVFDEYSKLLKDAGKNKNQSEKLYNDKALLEKEIEEKLKENEEYHENLVKAQTDSENLLNKINDAQKIKTLQSNKELIQKQFAKAENEHNQAEIGFHKKMFKDFWILKNSGKISKLFEEKFKTFVSKHYEIINEFKLKHQLENEILKKLETRLPFNVPDDMYVEKMLENEICLVCNREAKKESEAWLKIKELIDRKKERAKIKNFKPFKNDFEEEFESLYHNAKSLNLKITNVDESISEALLFRRDYENKRNDLNDQLKKIEEEIEKILLETKFKSANEAVNIVNELRRKDEAVNNYRNKLERNNRTIEKNKYTINEILQELRKNSNKPVPEALSEKVNLLKDIRDITISTRDRIYKELIERLEIEMNKHYQEMTAKVTGFRGIIKLIDKNNDGKNYMPQIYNEDGSLSALMNTSNLMLIKLSTIMAIISAKKDSPAADLYTLISDAPLSTFGEGYILGFCKTVSKVYNQSIIMSKEFYYSESLRNELLNNPEIKIGNVYTIKPSISERERGNQNNLSITIKKIN